DRGARRRRPSSRPRLHARAHDRRLPRPLRAPAYGGRRAGAAARGGAMRVALFYHSLVSDWNHGNAHFLRGVVSELDARGHEVRVWEPRNGWSRENLVAEHGQAPLEEFQRAFPHLRSELYDPATLDPARADAAADRAFRPVIGRERQGDVVWIGNWGDGERTAELRRFLLEPARRLHLDGSVFGVRYPTTGRRAVRRAGLAYRGWIANHRVPL